MVWCDTDSRISGRLDALAAHKPMVPYCANVSSPSGCMALHVEMVLYVVSCWYALVRYWYVLVHYWCTTGKLVVCYWWAKVTFLKKQMIHFYIGYEFLHT